MNLFNFFEELFNALTGVVPTEFGDVFSQLRDTVMSWLSSIGS